MRELRAETRLQVRQQVELAAVVGAVAASVQVNDAIRVLAAAERPRHQMRPGRPAACHTRQGRPAILNRRASEADRPVGAAAPPVA